MAKDTGHPRRSTGNVMEPGDGYLPNGKPNLSPSAGYVAAEPVQYGDESDAQFAIRMAEWNSAKAHAKQIEVGGATFAQRRDELEAKLDVDLAALDKEEARVTGKPVKAGKGK